MESAMALSHLTNRMEGRGAYLMDSDLSLSESCGIFGPPFLSVGAVVSPWRTVTAATANGVLKKSPRDRRGLR